MKKYDLQKTPAPLAAASAFTEASAEELRVLLVLLEQGGEIDEEALSHAAKVSRARCAAAVTLWREAGVLCPAAREDGDNTVTDAHPERIGADALCEQTGEEVARDIRENQLASLLEECAELMGKTTLSSSDVRQIVGLCTQYALSEEYIAALAAHIAEHGKLTAPLLVRRAVSLVDKGVSDPETLAAYLAANEKHNGALWEVRQLLGIYHRALSAREEEYFTKWMNEYAFSTEIIGEAYDITVINTGKASVSYMNTLLGAWHKAGCKTVADVRALREREKAEKAENADKAPDGKKGTARRSGSGAKKPRYGDFDPEEMMRKAIERSFSDEKKS